ncbi:MAG: hypothetical protein IK008_02470 [Bacteroidales bacterium]|nr:hypothetical protein [Bacteroidales bacterium]
MKFGNGVLFIKHTVVSVRPDYVGAFLPCAGMAVSNALELVDAGNLRLVQNILLSGVGDKTPFRVGIWGTFFD